MLGLIRAFWGGLGLLALLGAVPAAAELRISALEVALDGPGATVHVALMDAVPLEFHESLHSGVATHLRVTVELWQYNRLRPDRRLHQIVLERTLSYNVVTREYKISPAPGDPRAAFSTRELREAQRLLSELRGVRMVPALPVAPDEVVYIRVHAESALNGHNSWMARMSGAATVASRRSDYLALSRLP